ncbi:MAG: AmmeMemoRadiSam system protein B [Magnetococcus sp. DMHC-1]
MLRNSSLITLLIVAGAATGLFWLKDHLHQEVSLMNSVHAAETSLPSDSASRVRPPAWAGSWYPATSKELGSFLDRAMESAKPAPLTGKGPLRALIVPHAGYRYSGATAAAAFKLLREHPPLRRIIVIGPSHRQGFAGISIPDVTHFETPLGRIPLDQQAIAALRTTPLFQNLPTAHQLEHSIEIELPFLQRVVPGSWQLLPILVGSLNAAEVVQVADLLRPLADDATLVVVSSDFTHFGANYNYLPFSKDAQLPNRIRELDQGAIDHILHLDGPGLLQYKQKTDITACGLLPMAILLHMAGEGTTATLLQYATSGEMTQDYSNSVSYVAMAFTRPQPFSARENPAKSGSTSSGNLPQEDMSLLLNIARATLQKAVTQREGNLDAQDILGNVSLSNRMQQPAGAFVTLKKNGELRGCIGHIQPVRPLFEAVMENAVSAALADTRFKPVTRDELQQLTVEVSVLSPMRPIASLDEYQVARHGIVLIKNGRRAVFLPEVATEQKWDRDTTLTQLARKAGLPDDAWKDNARFEVFTTQTIHESAPPKTLP